MRVRSKSLLAMSLAVVMMLSVLTGCGKQAASVSQSGTTGQQSTSAEVAKEPAKISILLQDSTSWKFNKESPLFKTIEEKVNVSLDLMIIPQDDYYEKKDIIVSSGDMPDVLFENGQKDKSGVSPGEITKWAQQGVIIPLDDLINKYAPNIKRFFPDEEKVKVQYYDNQLYSLPRVYNNDMYYLGWLARQDIMDEIGVKAPETLDEFYSMLKAMKVKYPDTYPIVERNPALMAFLCSWGVGEGLYMRNEKFELGGTRGEDKECVAFINKLYEEKLIDPEFSVCTTQQWEERMSNSKGFVTWDYMQRCEFFNNAVQKDNPKYNMVVIPLPKAGTSQPNVWVPDRLYTDGQFVISAKTKVAEEAIKMFDYLYSDEGIAVTNWGIEGTTYKKEGDAKTFLPDVKTADNPNGKIDVLKDFNVQCGFEGVADVDALVALNYGKNSSAGIKMSLERNYARPNPPAVNAFMPKEDLDKINELQPVLDKYIQENLLKFMMGKRPIGEWDQYVNELKKLKLDDYLKVYQDAYNKSQAK